MNFLTISHEQMQQLQAHQEASFLDRLVDFLHEQFPETADEPQETFRQALTELIERSESWGLAAEDEIARYCVTAWLLGVDFDQEFPVAADILGDRVTKPQQRSVQLLDWATELFRVLEAAE
ncbi:MAG: hypothetical protein VBE63_21425 [Lamprobacter sp.]|uniref:hypothetical protein n=1 Tax=Lamprobacter sp. TaxID=3100796 RepID=UPI002B25E064|nr:hypothetical protein [Lamprobacter sp.]MEA3642482.1 hypothetical protein [Lamprobacter sp.]